MHRHDTTWFISKASQIHGDLFDYSNAEYIDAQSKISIRCKIHDHSFEQKYNDHFKSKYPCKHCLSAARNNMHSDGLIGFQAKLIKRFGDTFDLSTSKYVNARTKITIRCKECGEYKTSEPHSILIGIGCNTCFTQKTSLIRGKEKLKEINSFVKKLGGRCVSKKYTNNEAPLEFKCKNGHEFQESWSDVQFSMRWCKECSPNRYIGETLSRMILEHYFRTKLPSVYLPEMNGLQLDGYSSELKIAFEYQGYQHVIKNSHFHKEEGLYESQVKRDKEKKELCSQNGITLIEIPEFKSIKKSRVPKFVDQILNKLNSLNIEYREHPFEVDLERLYQGRDSTLYEDARKILLDLGFKIQDYIGSESEHEIVCNQGHKFSKLLSVVIKSGPTCPFCKEEKTFETLVNKIQSRNGKLIDTKLKPLGLAENYNWICESGHINQTKGYYIFAGNWCKQCQKINKTKYIPVRELVELANDISLSSEEKAKKLGISVGTYYRKLLSHSIHNNSSPQDRTKQNIQSKSKGKVYQVDPNSLKVLNVFSNLEAVKRFESATFKPEGIRPALNKKKLAYGFFWLREGDKHEFFDSVKLEYNDLPDTKNGSN
jgi:hypothetical protein